MWKLLLDCCCQTGPRPVLQSHLSEQGDPSKEASCALAQWLALGRRGGEVRGFWWCFFSPLKSRKRFPNRTSSVSTRPTLSCLFKAIAVFEVDPARLASSRNNQCLGSTQPHLESQNSLRLTQQMNCLHSAPIQSPETAPHFLPQ